MYKIIKKSRAIQSVILLLTLLAMITIYPLRIWEETISSTSNQVLAGSSDSVSEDYMLQRFIAQYDHLGTINLYLTDFENGWNRDQRVDSFLFRMLDSDMQIMFEQEVDVRFIDVPGFCPVYINEDLEVGKDYYFFLQGVNGSRTWFGLEETASAGTPYVSRLIYNYDELAGYNIIGEYNYTVPLRKDKVFFYDAILAAAAFLCVAAVELYYRKTKRDRLVTVEQVCRVTANVLAAAITAAGLWNISIKRYFTGRFLDNIFYTIGLLFASATLFYLINHKKDRSAYVPLKQRWKEKGGDILQSVFFAGTVWACCNYMNGLYEIHHRVAERQLTVFLALAAIVMAARKEIFNKLTLAYTAAAIAVTMWYRSIYVDYLAMDEWDLRILRWGIAGIILGGFLLVSILKQLINKRKPARISLWFGLLLTAFFALLIVFRNTRWWPVAMVVMFTLFYFRYALWEKRTHLLHNICNGLVLHFLCSMIFSFARRPFLSWIYPRFPFIFHTVTITAVYLTIVLCAVMVLLAERYRLTQNLSGAERFRALWKELLLFGLTATYLLFTASRTGFLAVAAMAAVVFIFLAMDLQKQKIKKIAVLVGMMIVSVVWCFPMAFTGQRILPAVCNNVYKYEVEVFPDPITRGNEWDSMYYITVERFFEVFNNKIFGIPESGSSSYERSEEYQKYRAKRFNSKGEVVWEGSVEEANTSESSAADSSENKAALNDNTETAEKAGAGKTEGDKREAGKELEIIGIKSEEERAAEEAEAAKREQEAKNSSKGEPEKEEEKPEEEAEETSVYEKTEEYANGRMDIFRAYFEQLNLTGHEEMGVLLPDGSLAVHAHNIYLQAAYDHGLIVGILFVAVGAAGFVQGCIYYKKRKNEAACAALPAAVIMAFAVAGLVEWIFHWCNPAGFVLMLILAPLLFDMGAKKDKADEER